MKQTYQLQVASTGETIRQETTEKSMVVWWRRAEKKVLRDRRVSAKFKEAIRTGDVVVGWMPDIQQEAEMTPQEREAETRRVMRKLDLEIEKRLVVLKGVNDATGG